MKVILTNDVVGLGDIGAQVTVKPGYARNFLIPRGLAFETTAASAKQIAHNMKQIEAKKLKLKALAEEQAEKVRNISVSLDLRVGSGGKAFGSIGAKDIAAKLAEQGFDLDRRRVLLSENIKQIGIHFVDVKLHADVTAQVKVEVKKIAATKDEEAQEAKEAMAKMEEASAAKQEAEEAQGEEEVVEETEVSEEEEVKSDS